MLALQVSDAVVAPQLFTAAAPDAADDSASDSESCSEDDEAVADADEAPAQQQKLVVRRSGSDHEQEQPNTRPLALAGGPLPPVNKRAPTLTTPGYFTVSFCLLSAVHKQHCWSGSG